MRNILLSFVFMMLTIGLYAQSTTDNTNLLAANYTSQSVKMEKTLQIFPNPATNYIGVSNNDEAKHIVVFNLVGHKMKSFAAMSGEKYFVGDLKRGMYLVQILDSNKKVLTTQRVSKK